MVAIFSTLWAFFLTSLSAFPILGTLMALLRYVIQLPIVLMKFFLAAAPSQKGNGYKESNRDYFKQIGLVLSLVCRCVPYYKEKLMLWMKNRKESRAAEVSPQVPESESLLTAQSASESIAPFGSTHSPEAESMCPDAESAAPGAEPHAGAKPDEEAVFGFLLFKFIESLDEKYRKLLLDYLYNSVQPINTNSVSLFRVDKSDRSTYKKRMVSFMFHFFDTEKVIYFLMNGWFSNIMTREYRQLLQEQSQHQCDSKVKDLAFELFYEKYGAMFNVPYGDIVYRHKFFNKNFFSIVTPQDHPQPFQSEYYRCYFSGASQWGTTQSYHRIRDLERLGFWAVFSLPCQDLMPVHYNLIYQGYCKGQILNDLLDYSLKGDIPTNHKLDMVEALKKFIVAIPDKQEATIFKSQLAELLKNYATLNNIGGDMESVLMGEHKSRPARDAIFSRLRGML